MTQDQSSSVHGTDYVVRGEVVPDDDTEEFQSDESGPMTRLRKVASAMRGDKPDQTVPDEMTTTDPNGSFFERPGDLGTMSDPVAADETDAEYAGAAPADDVAAVRSPQTGDRNYWDDEQASREPAPGAGMTATDPDLGPGPVADDPDIPVGTGPSVAYPTPADTMAEDHRETGTAADPLSPASSIPADTSAAGTVPAGTVPAGKHAAAAEDAGLRPGEATDRLGDFGDIAFGNLLPDAAQYSAQWQQIQFRFVDDPQASVTEAADVLSQVTAKLEAAIQERQRAIEERKQAIQERASALRGRWGEGSNADTETLRETLRMYRAFMDQLIGSTS